MSSLAIEIMDNEGYRRNPYQDPNGNWTGGWGHLLSKEELRDFDVSWDGFKKDMYWVGKFKIDFETSILGALIVIQDFYKRPSEKQLEVMVEMIFNLGLGKFRKFKRMLAALSEGNIKVAANEMIDSDWHRDFVRWNNNIDSPELRSRKLERKMLQG